jgi:hypothetical protein
MLGLKACRWNHIFREDGKVLVVAMDHPSAFGMIEGAERTCLRLCE